jgi:DNA-binding CsgD family transcriptional regulator
MSKAARASSIADLLPQVKVPTFVTVSRYLRDRRTQNGWFLDGQVMASRIPNSTLDIVDLDSDHLSPDETGVPPLVPRIVEFLDKMLPAGEAAPARHQGGHGLRTLSGRQRQILDLIAQGKTNREIADALFLSERTVQRHVADAYARIGARNRAEATAIALNVS